MIEDYYLKLYSDKYGVGYPCSSEAFYSFCDIVCKSSSGTVLGTYIEYFEESTGDIVSSDIACDKNNILYKGYSFRVVIKDSSPVIKLVNYVRGKSSNSCIDFDEVLNSGCTQLLSLVNYIVKRNGGTTSKQLWDFSRLCDKNTINKIEENDDVKNLVSDLFAEFPKYQYSNIIEDRWKGFSLSNNRGMDALARL